MKQYFSHRAREIRQSVIRELLKLTERPEIISFAGGLPDAETFPAAELADIAFDQLRNDYQKVLQYGTTEGSRTFRNAVIEWMRKDGLNLSLDHMVVTNASQQGLDLIGKTFIDPQDVVFCGAPTYVGAIQAFRVFQADMIGIPLADDGINLDILQREIKTARAAGKRLKLIYEIPDFQNPSGITLSLVKRKKLLKIADQYDLLIVEDDPYGKLRYSGEPIPSLKSLDTAGRVILLFTFSKILAAGLRIAVVIADPIFIKRIVLMKQAADLCTPVLMQRLAARYMLDYDLDAHLEKSRNHYRIKRDAMLAALDRYMPVEEGVSWTKPDGGLFLWIRLPEEVDTEEMLPRALERNVAYVNGSAFYCDGGGKNTMRLSFSAATEEEIKEGIKRLAEVVCEEIARCRTAVTS
ncbi:PLP-dependent aminotransferase family protein [Candidatus Acetothermia bacterium]|nr:PLP-dependent aminotransferase family protein [Candidatus Acetothermia bacterium]MCI2427173.1 PLP-dependent aminotransferase family protein [Candidatus Acetothermia bacterium]MCI2428067.1 PLP-dependent aminotransferase family protein [Candidatus Acetothermia bacterium]